MAGELLLSALRHIWAALGTLKIDAALMGGLAVAAWNHVRNTRDVDLLVRVQPGDEAQFLRLMTDAGCKFLREPPFLMLGPSRILQMSYEPPGRFIDLRIDLFFAESEYQELALSRRVELQLPGMDDSLFMLSCEDLILFKLHAGRILDRSDCAYLLRFNRDTLDVQYIVQWVHNLQLTSEFAEIWREAFGDDEPPTQAEPSDSFGRS